MIPRLFKKHSAAIWAVNWTQQPASFYLVAYATMTDWPSACVWIVPGTVTYDD